MPLLFFPFRTGSAAVLDQVFLVGIENGRELVLIVLNLNFGQYLGQIVKKLIVSLAF